MQCSVNGCEQPKRAGGFCTLHYQRFRKTGDPGPARPQKFRGWDTERRFRAYVQVGKDHDLWIGGLSSDGYGSFYLKGKKISAHRMAWELANGPIPDGLELDHLCSVRACLRLSDLELVTHHENVLRGQGWAAKHARSTHCPRGHEYDMVLAPTPKRPNGGRWCSICTKDYRRAKGEEPPHYVS